MFIIGGLIVPQLRGWGYAFERDVRGFHFRWKWKPVRWSWGIGGMELISLLTQVIGFGVLGGGGNFFLGGKRTGGKCLMLTNTI